MLEIKREGMENPSTLPGGRRRKIKQNVNTSVSGNIRWWLEEEIQPAAVMQNGSARLESTKG